MIERTVGVDGARFVVGEPVQVKRTLVVGVVVGSIGGYIRVRPLVGSDLSILAEQQFTTCELPFHIRKLARCQDCGSLIPAPETAHYADSLCDVCLAADGEMGIVAYEEC